MATGPTVKYYYMELPPNSWIVQ